MGLVLAALVLLALALAAALVLLALALAAGLLVYAPTQGVS